MTDYETKRIKIAEAMGYTWTVRNWPDGEITFNCYATADEARQECQRDKLQKLTSWTDAINVAFFDWRTALDFDPIHNDADAMKVLRWFRLSIEFSMQGVRVAGGEWMYDCDLTAAIVDAAWAYLQRAATP